VAGGSGAARCALHRHLAVARLSANGRPTRLDNRCLARDLLKLSHQFRCAKVIVSRNAIDIFDRALTISGGSGYLAADPLSRMCRDVRAGPFVQPYSPVDAYEHNGRIALGAT
jgi:alkylation response protein AidB-like acyl-CoA dehydrogenase